FFSQADQIAREAQFIINSLPNVEPFTAERSLRKLKSVHQIILRLDDAWISNIRIERGWRDVRKDVLEFFRQLFQYLEENMLLDMENAIERVCLFLVFQPRIQAALDRFRNAWNYHKIRTARNRTPVSIFELSRVKAMRLGYWTGDPGDDVSIASAPEYGQEQGPLPPADELALDPEAPDFTEFANVEEERTAGIFVNNADEIDAMRAALEDFDFDEEDGQDGISVYCRAV
ncbi:hypothetical protein C8F01DRAFT_967376, partial [Mycena amicta]